MMYDKHPSGIPGCRRFRRGGVGSVSPFAVFAGMLCLLCSCTTIAPMETRLPETAPQKEFKVDLPGKVQEYASPE
ncbi:MAG: hypothetical protein HGA56_04910, partial [Chlorobiaceae bacterium]|nr:hypothetical protein [Chlorobiaceae bacterium]